MEGWDNCKAHCKDMLLLYPFHSDSTLKGNYVHKAQGINFIRVLLFIVLTIKRFEEMPITKLSINISILKLAENGHLKPR